MMMLICPGADRRSSRCRGCVHGVPHEAVYCGGKNLCRQRRCGARQVPTGECKPAAPALGAGAVFTAPPYCGGADIGSGFPSKPAAPAADGRK